VNARGCADNGDVELAAACANECSVGATLLKRYTGEKRGVRQWADFPHLGQPSRPRVRYWTASLKSPGTIFPSSGLPYLGDILIDSCLGTLGSVAPRYCLIIP
jgi:hypothetical protein